ncbi:hypothetical protein HF526_17155 [Pseudonocardia sp. K10HN5]|uniref:Ribulose 1,5-bisphosphate carboxylase large subunit n=2 Tax=Pseudonocardia acidicola TaxID=2724939 RepID=A0ABX1SBS4_9PSEU|nr:hypothetical protein [Pseudonocardia acidicola]
MPGPSELIAGARAVAGWTEEAVGAAMTLPERAVRVLDGVDGLLGRVGGIADRVDAVVDRVDGLLARVDGVVGDAESLLGSVRAVADAAGGIVARADQVAESAAGLVARADKVAIGAAGLVADAGRVATEAQLVVTSAGGVAGDASGVIEKATAVADRAGVVVEQVATTSTGATDLLATYQPIAQRAAPLAAKFVDELSDQEVQAAIRLVDQLPVLTEHLESDILPILATLDRVGPDVHELLEVLKEVRLAINGIPGFTFFRRRGEERE